MNKETREQEKDKYTIDKRIFVCVHDFVLPIFSPVLLSPCELFLCLLQRF